MADAGGTGLHVVAAGTGDAALTRMLIEFVDTGGLRSDLAPSELRLGGKGEVVGQVGEDSESVMYAQSSVSGYNKALVRIAGKPEARLAPERLALLSKSAALLSSEQKREMKMLEGLGDAALTLAVAEKCVREKRTPQEYQNARSAVTANATLSKVYVASGLDKYVMFASGVSPGQGNVGAYALEALLGTFQQVFGCSGVYAACETLGIFDQFAWS